MRRFFGRPAACSSRRAAANRFRLPRLHPEIRLYRPASRTPFARTGRASSTSGAVQCAVLESSCSPLTPVDDSSRRRESTRRCAVAGARWLSNPHGDGQIPPVRDARPPGRSCDIRVKIRCVKRRRALLLTVLVYVGLDLSLPAMPGAFMFDPAGSVESVDLVRSRPTAEIAVITAPIRDWSVPRQQPPSDVRHRLPSNTDVAPPGWPVVRCLPRATCAPSPPSEDPH